MSEELKALSMALTAPFPPDCVRWLPVSTKDRKALVVAYLDARAVMQRLDTVFGVGGWQDDYQFLPCGSVVCTLSVKVGEQWVKKTDVGSPSEQADEGNRVKASVSDALKRAAVKVGIGRYLYRLPLQWLDYDPQTKRLLSTPTLPSWAIPAPKKEKAA